MAEARLARKGLAQSLREGIPLHQTISTGAASLLLGIRADILENFGYSVLVRRNENGVALSVDDTRETAMEAIRDWSEAPDKKAQGSFAYTTYRTLYGVLQGAQAGMGDVPLDEVSSMFLSALAERDPSWLPYLDQIQGYGGFIGDEEARAVHKKMSTLWQEIPSGLRSGSLASYSPNHLFGG